MRILWIKTDFLHPTTRGGQIRSLETLKRLHERHEVHYVAFEDPKEPEGVARANEYCTKAYPVWHSISSRRSPKFALDLLRGLVSPLPVAVERFYSPAMKRTISSIRSSIAFDAVVCDFLAPAPNIAAFNSCILFQHNVETAIWDRHVAHAKDPLRRAYFKLQAKRMHAYERRICRAAAHVIAVSENDAALMRSMFDISSVTAVPTGVDLDYFAPPASPPPITSDLVFIGSMDWMPNVDGIQWFSSEVLPRIHSARPGTTLAIVGRKPGPEVLSLASRDSRIRVTGTVPDVRPYLWGAALSIVPLRIGGGTRLKIFESMAARVPVVSTSIGAEGLDVHSPENILLADSAQSFAEECLRLLDSPPQRHSIAGNAFRTVSERFSWKAVTAVFEEALHLKSSPVSPE